MIHRKFQVKTTDVTRSRTRQPLCSLRLSAPGGAATSTKGATTSLLGVAGGRAQLFSAHALPNVRKRDRPIGGSPGAACGAPVLGPLIRRK